jgi:hypothetical protein
VKKSDGNKADGTPDRRGRVKLAPEQLAERSKEVVKHRLLFPTWTWGQIAESVSKLGDGWEITDDGCRLVYGHWLEEKDGEFQKLKGSTAAIVQERLALIRQMREMAAKIALGATYGHFETRDENGVTVQHPMPPQHANALGAISRVAELSANEVTFLQEMGLMPRHLGAVKLEIEAKAMVRVFIDVLETFVPAKKLPLATAKLLEDLRPAVPESVTSGLG